MISQVYSNFKMRGTVLQMALVCQKDLNELIGLNEYDYYSKVLKTIIIRSTK